MRLRLLELLCFSIALSCGVGVNPLTNSTVPFDPNDPLDPNNPNSVPSAGLISPTSGTRGTAVTITGTNFNSGTRVRLGTSLCAFITVVSPTELTCYAGGNGPGVADLVVSNAFGVSSTLTGAFTFRSYLYVANSSGILRSFAVSADGSLTPGSETSSVSTSGRLLAVDPLGKFVFVFDSIDATISVHRIDPETGGVSPVGISSDTTNPSALSTDAQGRYLYLTTINGLRTYSIDRATGNLTSLGTQLLNTSLTDVLYFPGVSRLIVTEGTVGNEVVHALAVAGDGSVSDVAGSPIGTPNFQQRVVATEGFAVTNGGVDRFDVFRVSASGEMTFTSTYTISESTQTSDIATSARATLLFSFGNGGTVISSFFNQTTGALSYSTTNDISSGFSKLIVDPSERFVLLSVSQDDSLKTFAVNPLNGALIDTTLSVGTGSDVTSMEIL